MFHVTPAKNVPLILKEGLRPQQGDRSQIMRESEPAIFLFKTLDEAEDALFNWLGAEFPEDEELAILEVEIPVGAATKSDGGYETAVLDPIPPANIKFIKTANEITISLSSALDILAGRHNTEFSKLMAEHDRIFDHPDREKFMTGNNRFDETVWKRQQAELTALLERIEEQIASQDEIDLSISEAHLSISEAHDNLEASEIEYHNYKNAEGNLGVALVRQERALQNIHGVLSRWKEKRKHGAVKTAISLPEIVRQTNSFSKKYLPGCQASLLNSNPKELFLQYNVKCAKADSDPAGHDVRVQFDVSKVEETQQAKDLDLQCSCSCPAFLMWGAQWNLHQRDALLGPARPLLQAPKERLDLRGNYVICKHLHCVFLRILPSVQHNIINILRKREVDRRKEDLDKLPERLHKDQEEMKKRRQIEKIRKTKDKETQQKLIDALKKEEESRLLHEEDIEEQVGEPVIQRTEPATQPHEEPVPEKTQPESEPETQELDNILDLTQQEEKKLHDEKKPHVHTGLPYEIKDDEDAEGWQGQRLSFKHASTEYPGLIWRAPETKADYEPSGDYETRESSDPELTQLAAEVAQQIYQQTKQPFELWDSDLTYRNDAALYIDGTHGYPTVLIDLEAHRGHENQLSKNIRYELKHAIQDAENRNYDEDYKNESHNKNAAWSDFSIEVVPGAIEIRYHNEPVGWIGFPILELVPSLKRWLEKDLDAATDDEWETILRRYAQPQPPVEVS